MPYAPPNPFNIANYFLDDRLREGLGGRTALRTAAGELTYAQVAARSNQFANHLKGLGVGKGDRVIIGLTDTPNYPAALFGILKTGAQVVMVNPHLASEQIADFYDYVEPKVVIVGRKQESAFRGAGSSADLLVVDGDGSLGLDQAGEDFEVVETAPVDPAIWLFSGGTTGRPKGVVQSHASFANTTECYAKGVLNLTADDVTLSVPKLYFGYATGTNLLFPFAVGATTVLFDERCTVEQLFQQIERHRPTVLINVPTMVNHMVGQAAKTGTAADLSSIRIATSAGEALPPELHRRWDKTFGVELLDGLGTAEMWHIFISNRPGACKPGTLGQVVPGFEVRLCDESGTEVANGEVGKMRVRGGSRALEYWRLPELTKDAFVDDWYISGDMMVRDSDGFLTYKGRADDLLKVSGKWLSPGEVENCLLTHPDVREAAVVG
ncbi:MAG: benzoate-CoA ligase family protein, partial [Longimicrobiales bacterium]